MARDQSTTPAPPARRPRGSRLGAAVALSVLLLACSSPADDGPQSPTGGGPAGSAPPAREYRDAETLGALPAEVSESSGLVASRRNAGRYWTHNDSGDGPFLYCIDGRGNPCGRWRVTGAEARDWEDIAAGPGPGDRPHLYVGDIGDNLGELNQIVVYRVAEPAVPEGDTPATERATERAEAIRLRYPDGPHDAEALLVHPVTGDLYVVTKAAQAGVYVARAPLGGAAAVTLELVAVLDLGAAVNPLDVVTGGDISPSGDRVVLVTYAGGYELRLAPGAAFDSVWQGEAHEIRVGARAQGEAVAYRLDGEAVLTTSERRLGPAPVLQTERR